MVMISMGIRVLHVAPKDKTVINREEPLGIVMNRYGRSRRNMSHPCVPFAAGIPGLVGRFGGASITERCHDGRRSGRPGHPQTGWAGY